MFAFEYTDNPFSNGRWMRIIRTRTALFANKLGALLGYVMEAGEPKLALMRY